MGNVGIKVDLILREVLFKLLKQHLSAEEPLPPVGVNMKAGRKIRATKAISAFPKTSGDRQPAKHPNTILKKRARLSKLTNAAAKPRVELSRAAAVAT